METITSTHNAKIKQLRKLRYRKNRDGSGMFAAEGEDLLAEALRFGAQPQAVYCDQDELERLGSSLEGLAPDVEVQAVERDVLDSVSTLGSGTRLIGVWKQSWCEPAQLTEAPRSVYLHEVSDPGNVGTAIRAALAFDAAIALSDHAADPFSPKAVRASMGALFAVPIVRCDFAIAQAAQPGRVMTALVPGAGKPLAEVAAASGCFAIGAERQGLPDRIVSSCDEIAHVPFAPNGPESLNAAMAATLCLYESATRAHRLSDQETRP